MIRNTTKYHKNTSKVSGKAYSHTVPVHCKKIIEMSKNNKTYDYYKYVKTMNEHEIDGIIAAIKNAR